MNEYGVFLTTYEGRILSLGNKFPNIYSGGMKGEKLFEN
ncbi:hypothetical protein QF028_005665 [Neobacillus sp. B4I6]